MTTCYVQKTEFWIILIMSEEHDEQINKVKNIVFIFIIMKRTICITVRRKHKSEGTRVIQKLKLNAL